MKAFDKIRDVAMSIIFTFLKFSYRIADVHNIQSRAPISIETRVIRVHYLVMWRYENTVMTTKVIVN